MYFEIKSSMKAENYAVSWEEKRHADRSNLKLENFEMHTRLTTCCSAVTVYVFTGYRLQVQHSVGMRPTATPTSMLRIRVQDEVST